MTSSGTHGTEPLMIAFCGTADRKVMARLAEEPPRTGDTRSRYIPGWTKTVSPGCATFAAA